MGSTLCFFLCGRLEDPFRQIVINAPFVLLYFVHSLLVFGLIFRHVSFLLPALRRAEQQLTPPPQNPWGHPFRSVRRRARRELVPTDQQIHQLLPEADSPNYIEIA